MQQPFDEIDVREIALTLRRDPRTVRKALRGGRVTPLIAAEIHREAARRATASTSEPPKSAA